MNQELRRRVCRSSKDQALFFLRLENTRKFALNDLDHPVRDRGDANEVKVDAQPILQ